MRRLLTMASWHIGAMWDNVTPTKRQQVEGFIKSIFLGDIWKILSYQAEESLSHIMVKM